MAAPEQVLLDFLSQSAPKPPDLVMCEGEVLIHKDFAMGGDVVAAPTASSDSHQAIAHVTELADQATPSE